MLHVLVVDDSKFQRSRISSMLQAEGCQITQATNGQEGLDLLSSVKPDLVFLDLLMPEVDGFGFLQQAQNTNCSVPIIVLTADIQETQREKCMELGATHFLNKPPKPEQLQEAIRIASEASRNANEKSQFDSDKQDAITEMINIGVGRAASLLNQMLSAEVILKVPEIFILNQGEIRKIIDEKRDEEYASVRLAYQGGFSGSTSLLFESSNASKLVSLLTDSDTFDEDLDTLTAATLTEVGNIVVNSVMGTIANQVEETLVYSVPEYFLGEFNEVVPVANDDADSWYIVANTSFDVREFQIVGKMILLFEVDSFRTLLERI